MYRLLLKMHNSTGMKYLCVTRKDDYEKYRGSGVYWLKHLKKHGYNFSTIVLHESEERDRNFIDLCLSTSKQLNIVESNEYANLMYECANSTRNYKNLDSSVGEKISQSLKKFWGCDASDMSDKSVFLRKHSSEVSLEFWNSEKGKDMRNYHRERMQNMDRESREKISKTISDRWDEMSLDERKHRSDLISKGRLSMTDDAKKHRSSRISDSFKVSEARKKFERELKTKRVGGDNPAAKTVHWDGCVFYSCTEFYTFCKENSISKTFAKSCLDSDQYPERYIKSKSSTPSPKLTKTSICPHCHKEAIITSAFKRWHFDNCKENNKNESR